MESFCAQRISIDFCLKLGKSASETYEMINTAYGDAAYSRSKVFGWYSQFKNGRTNPFDEDRPGRPCVIRNLENVEKIRNLLKENSRMTIREVSNELEISYGLVQSIIKKDLNMIRVAARFVPKILTIEQKEQRVSCCENLLESYHNNPDIMKLIIAGDETWVYAYDPETKRQSSEWIERDQPRPKREIKKNKIKDKDTIGYIF